MNIRSTIVAALIALFMIPTTVQAKLAPSAAPKADIFGGGKISLLYRVLDAHEDVRKSVGLNGGATFLAKGSTDAVYLVRGEVKQKKIVGEKLVFPNAKLYKTWFPDFSHVRKFSDTALENAEPAGQMLPAPGSLIKRPNDPKVYVATMGRLLRHIENESVARLWFGPSWTKQIFVLGDGPFYEYQFGPQITTKTRLTELDVPPLSTEKSIFTAAGIELSARTHRDIDQQLRDIYRQILAKRYLNILVAWWMETGAYPPSPHPQGGTRAIRMGVVLDDNSVAALTAPKDVAGAINYIPEWQCSSALCFAFVPDTQQAPCGVGPSPFIYSSTGEQQFALDFCLESEQVITIPEVMIEMHQSETATLSKSWYRFTERGFKTVE